MIETQRLRLRPLNGDDAAWIAREICHPDVQRWLTSPPHPYRLQDAHDYLARFGCNPWTCAIEVQGQPIGVVYIGNAADLDPMRSASDELGYWLQRASHGRGYMTEAAGALVHRFFETGADYVDSGWVEGNTGSEGGLTKRGFARTGVVTPRRVNFLGETRPIVRVRRSRADWAAAQPLETAGG